MKTRRYPAALTGDQGWQIVPLLLRAGETGQLRRIDLPVVLNAIRVLRGPTSASSMRAAKLGILDLSWSATLRNCYY